MGLLLLLLGQLLLAGACCGSVALRGRSHPPHRVSRPDRAGLGSVECRGGAAFVDQKPHMPLWYPHSHAGTRTPLVMLAGLFFPLLLPQQLIAQAAQLWLTHAPYCSTQVRAQRPAAPCSCSRRAGTCRGRGQGWGPGGGAAHRPRKPSPRAAVSLHLRGGALVRRGPCPRGGHALMQGLFYTWMSRGPRCCSCCPTR